MTPSDEPDEPDEPDLELSLVRCWCCGVFQDMGPHSDQPDKILPLTGAATTHKRTELLEERRAAALESPPN